MFRQLLPMMFMNKKKANEYKEIIEGQKNIISVQKEIIEMQNDTIRKQSKMLKKKPKVILTNDLYHIN